MLANQQIPNKKNTLKLFEYSVRKVIQLDLMDTANIHQVWANLIFKDKKNPEERSELMSIVKHEYPQYFSNDLKYMFLEDKIKENFPYLFGTSSKTDLFEDIDRALNAEYKEQKSAQNITKYRISSYETISSASQNYIYKLELIVEEGDDPHFSEGTAFEVQTSESKYSCEVIEYDYVNAILFCSSKRVLSIRNNTWVIADATMNTIALRNLLNEISTNKIDDTLPLHKFLNGTTSHLKHLSHEKCPEYLEDIFAEDLSQKEAFNAALNNDITFIWGPPGTGKSYTLAAIIMALYHFENERTAICCLSNVAVDQLVNKVVDLIEEHGIEVPSSKFYRAGRTQDEKLLSTDFLFPDDQESRRLRFHIKNYNKKLEKYRNEGLRYSDEAINIKTKLKDTREKLKEHTDYLISQVKVVFSTIANFVLNKRLKNGVFDNLIVDEASMLAEPQLVAIAHKISKRIILVGDFQQLRPITEAGVPLLRNSVFKLCGIDIKHTDHPALHQLLNQRRSNPELVEIINHAFYDDKLIAKNCKYSPIVARAPYSDCVIGMKSITNGTVRFTKGGTRQNFTNALAVLELLDLYSKEIEDTFSIGIITPYRGQVALLKRLFIGRSYNLDFQERIKIGTVHTFQGSECDVIIFDMVDCSNFEKGKKPYFGRIYAGEQGEQLLNVAISRARHKLIIICDPDYLEKCPGGVISEQSYNIFKKLLTRRYTNM